MENSQEINIINISEVNGVLLSAAIALHTFWALNILKEAFEGIKAFLTFYKPVGPLLGLFILSILAFLISRLFFRFIKVTSQKFSFWFFVISVILFFFMVFPPIFEPIAHILNPK